MSYLTQLVATFSRLGAVTPVCESESPWEDMKPSKSAPHVGVSVSIVSFDIGSIGARHKTSGELSISSVNDVLVSWSIIPVCERFPTRDGQT